MGSIHSDLYVGKLDTMMLRSGTKVPHPYVQKPPRVKRQKPLSIMPPLFQLQEAPISPKSIKKAVDLSCSAAKDGLGLQPLPEQAAAPTIRPHMQGVGPHLLQLMSSFLGSYKDIATFTRACKATNDVFPKTFVGNNAFVNGILVKFGCKIEAIPERYKKEILKPEVAHSITSLSFYFLDTINYDTIKDLVKTFPRLVELTFFKCLCIHSNSLELLSTLKLTKLSLAQCSGIDRNGFSPLGQISTLQHLDLSSTQLSNDSSFLKKLTELRFLNVSDTLRRLNLMENIAGLEKLEEFQMKGVYASSEELAMLPIARLKHVHITENRATSENFASKLAEAVRLESLTIDGALSENTKLFGSLQMLPHFSSLKMGKCDVSDLDYEGLKNFKNPLEFIMPRGIADQEFRKHILPLQNIKKLVVLPSKNTVDPLKKETVGEFRQTHPNVEVVST